MVINGFAHRNIAHLDGIRNRLGIEPLKNSFHDLTNRDPASAAKLINDPNLHFPTLFILQPEIRKCNLHPHLCIRNIRALDLVNDIMEGTIPATYLDKESAYPTLKWMLETGYAADGLNEHYDEVMDKAALMLTRVHHDKSCLSNIAELIFARHRKGFYIYDLVWAFFESAEPGDLKLIARGLRSSHPKDVELARKLLNFVPGINANPSMDRFKDYKRTADWLRNNRHRLEYTGESFQQGSNPSRFILANSRR